jgi:RNA polymerase sigma-70 factor (ECF subfamily)
MNDQQSVPPSGQLFERLWPAAAPRVRAYVMMSISSYHDAEDVVQETAFAISSSMASYDPTRPFLEWALGFARIRILRHLKSRGRHRSLIYSVENLDDIEAAFVEMEKPKAGLEDQLKFCVEKLSPRSRRLFDLRYARDLSAAAIAAETDMTIESVYARLSQIRSGLRKCIMRQAKAEEKR